MKKGSSMFSDLFMLFVLIVMMLIISAMLWAVVMTYASGLGRANRNINIWVFEAPTKNDGTLLAFMETTVDGIPMKELITLTILQDPEITANGELWIKYDKTGKDYDIIKESKSILDPAFITYYTDKQSASRKYLLRLTDPDVTLASNGQISTDDKVIVKIFGVGGETSSLELYVD